MRILVTGHNGYIGCVLVPHLLSLGHDVHGFDTNYYSASVFSGELPEVPSVTKDIRNAELSDVQGFDAVIHLAALSNDPLGDYQPELTHQINTLATLRLAKLAKAAGVHRFLFASSCSNYGRAGDDFVCEDSQAAPTTPYARSKVTVEAELAHLANEDFVPVFLRASTAYGSSPMLRFDLVINNLTAWAFTTGRIYLKSTGEAWRPVVHVADIARAYSAVLDAPTRDVSCRAFNIGATSENYRIIDLAKLIAEVVPNSEVQFAPGAEADARSYRVNCDRILSELEGFHPTWTAQQGIEQLHQLYRGVGLQLKEFEGERFSRIAHIKMLQSQGRLCDSLHWQIPCEDRYCT
ncbi:MAG: SDR family oxidoreductase [Pseudomonadota bacterium]